MPCCIKGYHVHQEIRCAVIGKKLAYRRGLDNLSDTHVFNTFKVKKFQVAFIQN